MTTLIRPKALSLTEWKQAAHDHEAPADALIRKYYSATVKAEGDVADRTVSWIISTASQDRDGDDIAVDGWLLDNYQKNPVVLWAHDYSQLPVGRSTEIAAFNGALRSVTQFAPKEVYPFADTVYQLILGGYLNATSVGFLPQKWEEVDPTNWWGPVHFLQQELLEYSIVPVPSNPEALVDAKSKGIDTSPLLGWAENVLSSDDSLDRYLKAHAEKAWRQLATKHTTGGNPDPEKKDIRIDATQCVVVDCDDPPVVAVPVCREHLDSLMDLDGEDDDAEVMGGYRVLNSVSLWAAGFTKSGRVLSAANEDRITEARDALNQVLATLGGGDDDEEDDDAKAAKAEAARLKALEDADAEPFFAIGEDEDEEGDEEDEGFEVDEEAIALAVGNAVAASLTAVTGRLPD